MRGRLRGVKPLFKKPIPLSLEGKGIKRIGLYLSQFVLGAQAPGAEVQVHSLATDDYRGGMNIWFPAPLGVDLGVADIIPEGSCFPADIALQNIFS